MSAPYYSDDLVTLYHGQALDVLGGMSSESVDLFVTSPPYNMGLTPGGGGRGMYGHTTQKAARFTTDGYSEAGDDALDPEGYAALRVAELWEMHRIARLGVFWNHRPRIIHGELLDPLDSLTRYGLEIPPVRQRIVLARPTGIDVGLTHFCTRGEYLYLFPTPDFRLVDHSASGMGDVWQVPIARHDGHPAPFAEMIPERCITATAARSVCDPFSGTGTTLAVAKRLGVNGIGIESDERYCEIAAKRLSQGVLDFGGAT